MRVVLLAGDLGWHRALARRLAGVPGAELAGVVAQSKPRAGAGRSLASASDEAVGGRASGWASGR